LEELCTLSSQRLRRRTKREPLSLIKKSTAERTSITGGRRYKWCYPVLASVGGAPGLSHTSHPVQLRYQYASASAVERLESSFGR
jgi:hypothetical protein